MLNFTAIYEDLLDAFVNEIEKPFLLFIPCFVGYLNVPLSIGCLPLLATFKLFKDLIIDTFFRYLILFIDF